MDKEERHLFWDRHQAEIWDRIFQVTQDVVTVAESLDNSTAEQIVRDELIRSAMQVGALLVRANAAEDSAEFEHNLKQSRLKAIETDYWLRLMYVFQKKDNAQRDLSSVITQYATIITMLQKLYNHTQKESEDISLHIKGPKVSL